MIFLTVGTQLPFDRLVDLVDQAAPNIAEEVFAQIGETSFTPKNISFAHFLSPEEFQDRVARSRLIVGHAGMGTLLTAAKYGKPVAVLARRREFNEHRNDHQLATVKQMSKLDGVYVFQSADELLEIAASALLRPVTSALSPEKARLISNIRSFMEGKMVDNVQLS